MLTTITSVLCCRNTHSTVAGLRNTPKWVDTYSFAFLSLSALRSRPLSVNLRAGLDLEWSLKRSVADLPAQHWGDKDLPVVFVTMILYYFYFFVIFALALPCRGRAKRRTHSSPDAGVCFGRELGKHTHAFFLRRLPWSQVFQGCGGDSSTCLPGLPGMLSLTLLCRHRG